MQDGALTRTGAGGDIITTDEFRNFELTIDWKIEPGGNSGIFYRASEDSDAIYWNAPEMQVLDDARHPDGQSPLTSAGAAYELYPAPHEVRGDLVFSARDVRNVRPTVDSMRLVKDGDEIARLRKATDISGLGHIAAMQAARPGAWEYEIEAALEAAFRRNGADRVGYPSIVGSGPNTTTLHYDVNRRQTRDGDLMVVDAGAEWGQ